MERWNFFSYKQAALEVQNTRALLRKLVSVYELSFLLQCKNYDTENSFGTASALRYTMVL